MEILTVAIQKGGTGKTTTAAALIQAAAYKGKKVLGVDLDPQGNLTFTLNANKEKGGSSYDLLHGTAAADVIRHVSPLIDVIPAAWELSTEKTAKGSARRLQAALEPIKSNYELIVIDTPPTAGELQYNALQAATGLIIPLQADIYSLQSLYQITDTAKQMQQSNPTLKIKGLILTRTDNRSSLARQMQENIIVAANKIGVGYLGSIRTGIVIQEAAALQRSIFEYAPNSKPANDYLALFEQII